MSALDWDDVIIPRNAPIVLQATNDDGANLYCGICQSELAWTEEGTSTRAFELGALTDIVSMHMDRHHSG